MGESSMLRYLISFTKSSVSSGVLISGQGLDDFDEEFNNNLITIICID